MTPCSHAKRNKDIVPTRKCHTSSFPALQLVKLHNDILMQCWDTQAWKNFLGNFLLAVGWAP